MKFRRQNEDRIRQLAPPTRDEIAVQLRTQARHVAKVRDTEPLNYYAQRMLDRLAMSLYLDAMQVQEHGTEPITRILPDLGLSEKG